MFWSAIVADIILTLLLFVAELWLDRVQNRAPGDKSRRLDRISSFLPLALFTPPVACWWVNRHGPAWIVLILSLLLLGLSAYFPPLIEARFRRLQRRKSSTAER